MATEIIATIRDESGDEATTSIRVPSSTLVAGLTSFATVWATALNNVIFGKIMSAIAYIKPDISSLTNNALLEYADVEHVGKFIFLAANGERVAVNVPALNEVTVPAGSSDELNQADTEVAAFIAAMETGIAVTGGTISPCDIGESSITDVLIAREAFRNSGKRR